MTLADFALTEGRFAQHFGVLSVDAKKPLAIADYLALDTASQATATAFIVAADVAGGRSLASDAAAQRLAISTELLAACVDRRHAAQVLAELAGVESPFTARIEADVAARLTTAHQEQLDGLQAEFTAELARQRVEQQSELTVRLRDRLTELAGRHRAATQSTEVSLPRASSAPEARR